MVATGFHVSLRATGGGRRTRIAVSWGDAPPADEALDHLVCHRRRPICVSRDENGKWL